MAEVFKNVFEVGDVDGQLLGAVRVEAGYGGDVGQVGGAAGGGDAAQQEGQLCQQLKSRGTQLV